MKKKEHGRRQPRLKHHGIKLWTRAMFMTSGMTFVVVSTSCTLYIKDAIHGSAYERTYEKVYDQAIQKGNTPEQAERQALFHAVNSERETNDRRKEERKVEDFKWIDLGWD